MLSFLTLMKYLVILSFLTLTKYQSMLFFSDLAKISTPGFLSQVYKGIISSFLSSCFHFHLDKVFALRDQPLLPDEPVAAVVDDLPALVLQVHRA